MQKMIDAAQGKIPCDLVLENARWLDVFSGSWQNSNIAILGESIVGFENTQYANKTIDLNGKFVVPGFIDAHVHIESSCMIPAYFEQAVLPHGTTSAICDPHELANVQGISGIEYFLSASELMQLNLFVMLSSCVPATHLETNGAGKILAKDLLPLISHRNALGLAEVMNVPGVLNHDSEMKEKLQAFATYPMDGHAPLLRGAPLSAYACTGISTCHECSEKDEAEEKLRKGIAVWIREGSVAKDLDALWPIMNAYSSAVLGFCTDDRNPLDISQEGHIDFLIRKCLEKGLPPEAVYRSASWSVARHYGLDRVQKNRPYRIGAIAPGFQADLVVLENEKNCKIHSVYKKGCDVKKLQFNPALMKSEKFINSVKAEAPLLTDLEGPSGQVHVIEVIPGKIITGRKIANADSPGVAKLSVLERHGKGGKASNSYTSGFGKNFDGAIASSVGHDSHNLIVVGTNTKDMCAALSRLIELGGGFCVAKKEKILADLALPIGGLMSNQPIPNIITALKKLREASNEVGCELKEPFLQLAFLSLPVIPSLKLTDKGLVDVEKFAFIDPRAQ